MLELGIVLLASALLASALGYSVALKNFATLAKAASFVLLGIAVVIFLLSILDAVAII